MEENLDNTVYDHQQGEALGIEEYLQTISIPTDQRGHTGVDTAWTRQVRTGTLLEQVEKFCSELRGTGQQPLPSETPRDQIIPHANVPQGDKRRQQHADAGHNNSSTMSVRVLGNTPKVDTNGPSSRIPDRDKPSERIKAMPPQGDELPARRKSLKNPLDSETKRTLKEIGSDIHKRVPPAHAAIETQEQNRGEAMASQSKELTALRDAKIYLGNRNEKIAAKGGSKPENSPKTSSLIVSSIASENDNQLASQDARNDKPGNIGENNQGDKDETNVAAKGLVGEGENQLGSDMSQSPEKKKVDKRKIALPPRLQAMKEKIKKMKLQQSSATEKKQPASSHQKDRAQVDQEKGESAVAPLQMTKDFDARKMVVDDVRKVEPTPTNLFLQNIFSRKP